MNSERWKQIEEIYYSALGAPQSARAGRLAEACKGDAELRSEVESLLCSEGQAGDFLSPSKLRGHIARMEAEPAVAAVGRTLGHYQILSAIGAGAMGEVYLARDTALDRQVALKL